MKISKLFLLTVIFSSFSFGDTAAELSKKHKAYEDYLEKTSPKILAFLELLKSEIDLTDREKHAMKRAIINYLAIAVEHDELLDQTLKGQK